MERKECIERLKNKLKHTGFAIPEDREALTYSISVLERVDEGKIAKICSEYEYKIREDAKKWATDSLKGLDKNIEGETDNSFLVGRLYADSLAHAIVSYLEGRK